MVVESESAPEPAAEPAPSRRPRERRLRSPDEARTRRAVVITWALSLALCALIVNSIVGENGYLAAVRVRREEAALSAAVARLRIENAELQQESRRLQSDPSALEEAAHGTLGLIHPGETLVIVHDAPPAPAVPPAK
jgi:cell division protein FtsB